MSSDDSESEKDKKSDDEVILPQVLDYYKKYSQSRRLPSYFRGSTSVKLDEREITENISSRPPLIGQDKSVPLTITVENVEESVHENPRAESPGSSIASNRKLEWDNGADIGYENVEQEEISLSEKIEDPSRFSPEGQKTDSSPQQRQSSGSSDLGDNLNVCTADAKPAKVVSATDSDSVEKPTTIKISFHDSLKRKIGVPIAESTPILSNEYVHTPVLRRIKVVGAKRCKTSSSSSDEAVGNRKKKFSTSCEDLSSPKSERTIRKWNSQQDVVSPERVVESKSMPLRKVINLCPTKPVIIECISSKIKKDKYVQTSLKKNLSAAVQTDLNVNDREVLRSSRTQQNQRAGVVYTQHSDLENSENKNTSSAQTDSEACVSECNSFEYLCGDAQDRNSEQKHETEPEKPILKRTDAKINLAETGQAGSSSSKSSIGLSELLTKKYSRGLITDIDHTIALIQKLVNSKRYDDITKRYYLRKIVDKIVNNCYSEDSSESLQNRQKGTEKQAKTKEKEAPKPPQVVRNVAEERYLQDNIPWRPVRKTVHSKSTKLKLQTFVSQFVPENVSSEDSVQTKKKSPFTLCHHGPTAKVGKFSRNTPHSSSGDAPSATDTCSSDWREQKTLSERLLEEQKLSVKSQSASSSDGARQNADNLVNFANRERQNQLSWINNEIMHLNRLKNLLEDKKRPSDLASIASSVLKPRVEDFQERRKSTTVYMVTTERADQSSAKSSNSGPSRATRCTCCRCNTNPRHSPVASLTVDLPPTKPCSSSVQEERPCPKKTSPLDLNNARLVSNEVFTTNSEKGRTTTSVARYCFEIPVDQPGLSVESVKNVCKVGCKCCAGQADAKICTKRFVSLNAGSRGVLASPCRADSEVQWNVPCQSKDVLTEGDSDLQCAECQCPETRDRQLKTDCIQRSASAAQTHSDRVSSVCKSCGCPLRSRGVETDAVGSVRNASCCTHGKPKSACGCQTKCPASPSRKAFGCQCTTDKERKKCACRECANQSNAPSEAGTQCRCCPKSGTRCRCCPAMSQDPQESASKESMSSSSIAPCSSSSSTSTEFKLCPCCRLNKVALPSERSVCDSNPTPDFILCHPCYQQCQKPVSPGGRPYFTYPGHVCSCYTVLKTSALNQIRKTVKDLQNIEEREEYCKCVVGKSSKEDKDRCEYCNCKLQKTRKARRGIAYMLTLESTDVRTECPKKPKNLPEITIKVPELCVPKKKKDKENRSRRCSCSPRSDRDACKEKKRDCCTLQQYLCANKPNFVEAAEERRKCLLQLAMMREQRCQKYKQLLALTCGPPQSCHADNKAPKLFTSKEMKAITAKHYKNLPEVQQKLVDNKERQIKLANRLLADMFNKKVRECALKGKTNLSTSFSVINFV